MITAPAFGWGPTWSRPVNPSPLDVDPYDEGARQNRIAHFEQYMRVHPGARPGGTGDTGLNAIDGQGWANLLEQQQQYAKDIAAESGKAGPSVRFGGYDGTNLTPKRGATPMASNAALRGLEDVIGGGNQPRGGSGRLPQVIADDPDLYKAYKDSLYDALVGQGRESRRAGLSPIDLAMEKSEAALRTEPYLRGMAREEDSEDYIRNAADKSYAYWQYTDPIETQQYDRYANLADAKGEAAAIDDRIRADASRYGADTRAASSQYSTDATRASAALRALQQEIANARTNQATGRVDQLTPQLDALLGGAGTGGGAGRAGGPGPTTQQTGQRFPPDIEAKIGVALQRGWTREDAIDYFRQHGLIR